MKTETPQIRLKIVSCLNGWAVYDFNAKTGQSVCNDSLSIEYGPSYVFSSPAELANAVANLVQFGCLGKPAEPRVLLPGFRPIAELSIDSLWYVFDTAAGFKEMFVSSGRVSESGQSHSSGEPLEKWLEQAEVIGFKSLWR